MMLGTWNRHSNCAWRLPWQAPLTDLKWKRIINRQRRLPTCASNNVHSRRFRPHCFEHELAKRGWLGDQDVVLRWRQKCFVGVWHSSSAAVTELDRLLTCTSRYSGLGGLTLDPCNSRVVESRLVRHKAAWRRHRLEPRTLRKPERSSQSAVSHSLSLLH